MVANFVGEVNTAHRDGYALDGTTGRDFFDAAGTTAGTIALSGDIADQPENVGAGAPILPGPTAPGIFDGRQAQLIGDLSSDGVTSSDYRTLVAGLAIDSGASGRRAETAQSIANSALDDAESVSGVNLDEELTNMMAAQRGFEASARVLGVVDEMLQTVIAMIR